MKLNLFISLVIFLLSITFAPHWVQAADLYDLEDSIAARLDDLTGTIDGKNEYKQLQNSAEALDAYLYAPDHWEKSALKNLYKVLKYIEKSGTSIPSIAEDGPPAVFDELEDIADQLRLKIHAFYSQLRGKRIAKLEKKQNSADIAIQNYYAIKSSGMPASKVAKSAIKAIKKYMRAFKHGVVPAYIVVHSYSISVPAGNPVGLAFDNNDNCWIMTGTHNNFYNTLICYDLNSGEILKNFQYHGLIEALGTGVYGIAWDGSSIFISVSGNVNKLVQIEPETGKIMKTISSPSDLGPSDLSWDGTNLWISTGTGEIYTINPTNGLRTIFLDREERDSGIAVKQGRVWVGNLFNNGLTIYDAASGNIVDTIENVLLDNGKLTFFHDQLAVLTGGGIDFYDIQ